MKTHFGQGGSGDMKKLYRSKSNKMISGVCGGIGEYLGLDPTLIRIGYALLSMAYGTGIFLYILFTVIIPEEN